MLYLCACGTISSIVKSDSVIMWLRTLLQGDETFRVPEVVWELTTKRVLTADLVHGETLDKMESSDQATRNLVRCWILSVNDHS